MLAKIRIHPRSDLGTMCECTCKICNDLNFLFFQDNSSPLLNGVVSVDPIDFKCKKCSVLLMSSQAVDTAYRSYLMGEDHIISLYFKSYGVETVEFTPDVPRVTATSQLERNVPVLSFWTRLRGAYRKSANAVKRVPLFVVSAVRAANKIGMKEDD